MKRAVRQKESVLPNSFFSCTARDNCYGYLKTDAGTHQAPAGFLAALIATLLTVRGRFNYRNLARCGSYWGIRMRAMWSAYHAQVIRDAVPATHRLLLAQDTSFIPKKRERQTQIAFPARVTSVKAINQ